MSAGPDPMARRILANLPPPCEAGSNGHDPYDDGPTIDPELVGIVATEMGLNPAEAERVAMEVDDRRHRDHVGRIARRLLDDDQAAKDQNLDRARAVDAAAFVAESESPPVPLLGSLVAEGHNCTVTAQYKAGKTTLLESAAAALVTGRPFLGVFDTNRPRRVAFLNYELTESDLRARLRALDLERDDLGRLLVVNLRGVRLGLTTPSGRAWLIDHLAGHRADVLIVDTYGAASAPSVESENDNAGGRRFLTALDEIKLLAGCPSLLMSAHTGRVPQAEGEERARGATVLDDWADVRAVLTRDKAGGRFLASDGRGAYRLPESRLHFDEARRRLTLNDDDLGLNRAAARADDVARTVLAIVTEQDGINASRLRDALVEEGVTNNGDKAAAINRAKDRDLIHTHKDGRTVRHYRGPNHLKGVPCANP
jgi:hypothetical protein